jgi:hypothetical protein
MRFFFYDIDVHFCGLVVHFMNFSSLLRDGKIFEKLSYIIVYIFLGFPSWFITNFFCCMLCDCWKALFSFKNKEHMNVSIHSTFHHEGLFFLLESYFQRKKSPSFDFSIDKKSVCLEIFIFSNIFFVSI